MAEYILHPGVRGMEAGNQRSQQRVNEIAQAMRQTADALNRSALADKQNVYEALRRQADIQAGVVPTQYRGGPATAVQQSRPIFNQMFGMYNAGNVMRSGRDPWGNIVGQWQTPVTQGSLMILPGMTVPRGVTETYDYRNPLSLYDQLSTGTGLFQMGEYNEKDEETKTR